jgi:hypothetical protein
VQVTPQMTVFGGAAGGATKGACRSTAEHRRGPWRQRRVDLRRRYLQCAGSGHDDVRRSGEAEVGGPSLSIIPKSGGNQIAGNAYLSGTGGGMIGSNYTDALKAAGLTTPGKLVKQWDMTFGIGGPIIKDRLWYRVAARDEGQHRTIPGIYPNLNAGDPAKFLYAPDKTREVRGAESWRLYTVRLTAQATSKDKINMHWDEQHPCNGATYGTSGDGCRNQPKSKAVIGALGLGGLTSTSSPEISQYLYAHPRVRQLTWSETTTNRILLEAGLGLYQAPFGPYEAPGIRIAISFASPNSARRDARPMAAFRT